MQKQGSATPVFGALIMQVAIIGNGAIGNLVATRCYLRDQPFSLSMRDPSQLTQNTMQVTRLDQSQLALPIAKLRFPALDQAELVVVPVKAYQVETVIAAIQPYLSSQQVIVLLHNGMGTLKSTLAQLPNNTLIVATTSHAGYKPSADSFIETGHGKTDIGIVQNAGLDLSAHQSVLNQILAPCTWHTDIQLPLWHKLAVNAVINPLTAIHQCQNGKLADDDFAKTKLVVCDEIAQIMAALGYPSSCLALLEKVDQVIQMTAQNYSSMNRDIHAGRKTEIDFINGHVVREGKRLGVATPENLALCQQIHGLQARL